MQFLFVLYKAILSPILHLIGVSSFGSSFACRYQPTCSVYFRSAVAKYGIITGGLLGIKRILGCHPWSKHPHLDPLP